jgi:DNA invertase Pin-like site-specific DNA recombinase
MTSRWLIAREVRINEGSDERDARRQLAQ